VPSKAKTKKHRARRIVTITRARRARKKEAGRPIGDLRPNVDIPGLEVVLREVMESLAMRERRVADKEGRTYSLRVRPYRTNDNKIDGAVITLVDINGKEEPDGGKAAKNAPFPR
jgi:hypothetical protein